MDFANALVSDSHFCGSEVDLEPRFLILGALLLVRVRPHEGVLFGLIVKRLSAAVLAGFLRFTERSLEYRRRP